MSGLFIAVWILCGIFTFICALLYIINEVKIVSLKDLIGITLISCGGIITASFILLAAFIIIVTLLPEKYPILGMDITNPFKFITKKLDDVILINKLKG